VGGAEARSASARTRPERSLWRVTRTLPRLALGALRHGLLPAGPAGARTLWREGWTELHWKILGDGLVRFLRHSGPLFTKCGQIMATRTDLLPAALCTAGPTAVGTRSDASTRGRSRSAPWARCIARGFGAARRRS